MLCIRLTLGRKIRVPINARELYKRTKDEKMLMRHKQMILATNSQQYRYYLTSSTISQSLKFDQKQQDDQQQQRILTIPNLLTMSRIASIPFISYFVLANQHEVACSLFFIASVTDFLDGYIARNFKNQQSNLGSIIDPLADKLLVGSLTITLCLNNMLPVSLALLILGRDVGLIMASLIVRYKTLDKPVTLEKFLNVKKYSSVKIEADLISKFNTFLQLSLITLTLPSMVFSYNESSFLTYLQYATGLTTILSTISYIYKGGSYKLIKKK